MKKTDAAYSRGRMACVLVIDDDAAVRSVVKAILDRAGHQVTTAEDGRRGLRVLESAQFDLLIIDIFMPDMDGFETIRQVRAIKSALPILVISGMPAPATSRPDFLAMATKLGAVRSLAKPFRPDALLQCVRACLT